MRRLAALVTVLAVASCFGRVSAWAAAPGDAHACCHGEAPSKAPALSECCAIPAAVGAVAVVRSELPPVLVSAPVLAASLSAIATVEDSLSPPGAPDLSSAAPARAPPLA